MWKGLGKIVAEVVIGSFLGGFLDEAGRGLAKKIFPDPEEEDDDEEELESDDSEGEEDGDSEARGTITGRAKCGKGSEKSGVGSEPKGDNDSV